MKLQSKFLVLLVPLVVVPLILVGWIGYSHLRTSAEHRTLDEIGTRLDRQRRAIQSKIRTATANVDLFSRSELIRKYLLTGDEDQRYSLLHRPLLRLLRTYQQAYPEYYEIRLLLPDGYEDARWTSEPARNVTENESASPFFIAIEQHDGDLYSQIIENPDNGKASLVTSKRLRIRDGSTDPAIAVPGLRGYLVLTVALDELESYVRHDRIGDAGFFVAADAAGNTLFQPDQDPANERLPVNAFAPRAGGYDEEARYRLVAQDQNYLVSGLTLHDQLRLFALVPEHQLLAASRRLGVAVATITLLAIVVTVVLLLVALRHIVIRPIDALHGAAQAVARGSFPVKVSLSAGDEFGELARTFELMSDQLKQSNDQAHFLAYHDGLTGLPNRRMFSRQLGTALSHAERSGELLAILFLDVDNFKRINDTHGHQIGDQLLQHFAEELTELVRNEDYVARPAKPDVHNVTARLGGDEFIILLRNARDAHAVGTVARRICELLSQSVMVCGHEICVSTSVGISSFPADGGDVDTLVKHADTAMYHAKELGKNNFQFYSASMNAAAVQRLTMENKLRRALEDNRFELHYQPKVDAHSYEVVGVEALLRWTDEELGNVTPGEFIPIAEETGLIVPIGRWVLNAACIQGQAWLDEGLPPITISVNVSTVQFARQNINFVVEQALNNSRMDPKRLELELTETAIMAVPEKAARILRELRELGVAVALDDFGTGYSSLSYLRRFPTDCLKIDRSFINEITADHDDKSIISAIIAMAHGLGLKVTAEGVEDLDQLRFLQGQRCDHVQGYLFSRPVPADQIATLLREEHLKIA